MLAFPSVAPVRWGFVKTGKANHMVISLVNGPKAQGWSSSSHMLESMSE